MKAAKSNKEEPKVPETLFQLLVIIIKGLLKNIPKTLLRIAIFAGLIFLLHTYLVIYPNGGFSTMGTRLSNLLELKQSDGSGTIIWSVMSAGLLSTISLIRAKGFSKFFVGIGKLPARVIKITNRKIGFVMILIVVGAFLSGYYWLKNDMMTLVFAIALILSAAAFRSSFTYVVMRLGYSDINRVTKRENRLFDDKFHLIILISLSLGFLLYTVLPKTFISVLLMMVVLISLGVLVFIKKNNQAKAAALFIGFNLFGLCSYVVYGDDGGVKEAGGLINWLGSQGSLTAVILGFPPALGGGLAGLIGWTLGEIGLPDLFDDLNNPEIIAETIEETMEDLGDLAEDLSDPEIMSETIDETVEDVGDLANDLTDPEIMSETIDETIGDVGDLADDLTDPEIMSETIEETVEDLGEIGDSIADGIDELGEEATDFVDLLEDAWDMTEEELSDFYDDLMDPENMGDTLVSTYDDFVNIAGDIGNQINDNMDWIIDGSEGTAKDLWEFMGNVKGLSDLLGLTPNGSLPVKMLGPAGIIKDALENFGLGDNPLYAGIKSWASNAVKGNLTDGTPVGLMELASNIFLGGTKADEIVNPGKTIQGTVNFVMDYFSDIVNGTNDTATRLDGGKYGGFYQTMDQAFEEAADAVYDTSNFINRLSENYTIDEFFGDMRTNNHDLWRVNEDGFTTKIFDRLASQPGSIFQVVNNRTACRLGEMVFDGLTYMGQGTAHAADFIAEGMESTATALDGYVESAGTWIKSLW